jgi:hypothetical protein
MVNVVWVKPPEQVRRRLLRKGRSGRIRVLQPEDELPLQICCRCSRPSYIRQPQVAGPARPLRTNAPEPPLKISVAELAVIGVSTAHQIEIDAAAAALRRAKLG